MKYILLEHADGNDPKVLRIFDTPEERIKATREAIVGEANNDPVPELNTLAQCGIVHFEGDPPLEWIDAIVPDATPAPVAMVSGSDCPANKDPGGKHNESAADMLRAASAPVAPKEPLP